MPRETAMAQGETIGQRLKRLRLERGLSQRELAAPGVSYAYISRIEAGTRQPSVKALRKLAANLGVTADFLESGSELDPESARELRLSDIELAVRLGDAENAEHSLEDLIVEAQAAADTPCAFRARVALAAVCEERGDLPRAIELLQTAVAEDLAHPAEQVDVFQQLGRAYAGAGRTARAVELFEHCLAECAGNPTLEARYAVMLSYALTDIGEIARAETVVGEALSKAHDTEDPYMRVRLYWSMARLSEAEGRASVALSNIRKAIALLETTEDAVNLGRAHILASRLLIEREKADEASAHLDRAEKLLGLAPAVGDLVEVTVQRSRIARIRREADVAASFAREALSLDSSPVDRGFALAALADALVLKSENDEASEVYAKAVGTLESESRWHAAANTARAWGQLLRGMGRESEAMDVLDRAAELGMRAAPQHSRAER